MMEMAFTHREPARKGAWVVVFLIVLAYVAAIAHGVMTIDVARDLFWAIEIASGREWPLMNQMRRVGDRRSDRFGEFVNCLARRPSDSAKIITPCETNS